MENLKVRVNNEAESKEVQELFFELGYGFEGCRNKIVQTFEYVNPFYFFAYSDSDLTVSSDNSVFSLKLDYKEITIQQLRDLVVLKRNDLSDKTHETATCSAKGFLTSDGVEYFWNYCLGKWDKYKIGDFLDYDMQPIEKKEMKEYLELQEDGSYKLVLRGDNCLESDIEVPPSGVNAYNYLYKNGINLAWTEKPTSYYGELLWQRSETEKVEGEHLKGIDATLAERQAKYGSFEDVAFVTESVMSILSKVRPNGLSDLPNPHRMSLYMIASKMARIVNGDFNHKDSWHDIGGYAKLIEDLIDGNS